VSEHSHYTHMLSRAQSSTSVPGPSPARELPGGAPLLGHLFDFRDRRLQLQLRVARECGDLGVIQIGPFRVHVLSSAELAHELLVEHAEDFVKSRGLKLARAMLGEGLLTSEHDLHKRQRKLMAPAFSHRRIASYASTMAELTERAQAALDDGAVVDVADQMMRLTLAIVGKTLFDAEVSCEADSIGEAMTFANHYVSEQVTRLPTPRWLPTRRNRQVKRAIATLDGVIYRLIAARRAAGVDLGDVLSTLVMARDEVTGQGMDDRQIRDEAVTLFLAGHETTANALAWSFYLLARHPDVYDRLAAESRAVLGGRSPTMEDLPRLPTALAVLKEAMRLYPPAYLIGRAAERDVTVGGVDLRANDTVFVNIYGMHRRADYFAEPERFVPERFSPEREKQLVKGSYLPFGGGPRICIGNHFAMMEGQLILAALAQRLRFERADERDVEPEPLVTLRPKGGLPMRVVRN
jgi:cytochrome P450